MYYPWLKLSSILKFLPEIEKQKVSEKARSENGFLSEYKKYNYASVMKRQIVPGENITWEQKRDGFISRTLPAYKLNPTRRRYLSLIAWAYNPN